MEGLEKNPYAAFEDKADPEVPTAVLQIYDWIQEYFPRSESQNVDRCSSATSCGKQLCYKRHGFPALPLTPRKVLSFIFGDITELMYRFAIAEGCVGSGKLYSEVNFGEETGSFTVQGNKEIKLYKQLEWRVKLADLDLSGHPDGVGKRNSDGKWELIEIKSAANWGFVSFRDQTKPLDYLRQVHALMMSNEASELGIQEVRFFFMRKDTSHLWSRLYSFTPEIAAEVAHRFKLAHMTKDELAVLDPPHALVPEMEGRGKNKKPTGRYTAAFPCSYCPYLKQCHGEHKIEWKRDMFGNFKPVQVFEKEK